MDTRRIFPCSVPICFCLIGIVCAGLALAACAGGNSSTIPTPAPLSPSTPSLVYRTLTPTTILSVLPTATPICTNNLTFINDITIPDGTLVAPGSLLDKQWLVKNSGDCNWDTRYRLRLISGDTLSASTELALFPARTGTQATLRILFTAPQESGEYISEWRAFDSNGISFGDSFFIKIKVQQ
jgi:hypothetical protein